MHWLSPLSAPRLLLYYILFGAAHSANSLTEWMKPQEIGTMFIMDESSFVEPYRSGRDELAYFKPYLYGYTHIDALAAPTKVWSFEKCMNACIMDEACEAFEINMLFLPFLCELNVEPWPCPEHHGTATSCSTIFQTHSAWRHFARIRMEAPETALPPIVAIEDITDEFQYIETANFQAYSVEVQFSHPSVR